MEDKERIKHVDEQIDRYMEDYTVRNNLMTGIKDIPSPDSLSEKPNLFIRLCHMMTEAFEIIFRKLYRTIRLCLSVFKSSK